MDLNAVGLSCHRPASGFIFVHMDRPFGQFVETGARARSGETRQRLLRAAAELISELGWGRVTTRAVARRAGLPHGAVSYHFRGKQELLTDAALQTIEHMYPMGELEAVDTLEDLISLVGSWVGGGDSIDPVLSGVMMEAMRESERTPALRQRLATMLRDYRRVVAGLVRAEQHRDAVQSGPAPSSLATLIAAVGDGLLLHMLLDPELDVVEATGTLLTLLRKEGKPGSRQE